jgi:hypothetical protein
LVKGLQHGSSNELERGLAYGLQDGRFITGGALPFDKWHPAVLW